MAFRYLIYSTGTTYAGTILRESALSGTTSGEARYYSDFVIPEIQPLYLWQVNNVVTPSDVINNTETKINLYLAAIAPAPQPQDSITYGQVTGLTSQKINVITGGVPGNIPLISPGGQLSGSTYNIADLITSASGVTMATFSYYTGTTAPAAFAKKSDALTGVTTSGTGSTLISGTTNRVVSLKSISTRGNLKIITGATDIIISGGSDVDTQYVTIAVFSGYTGTTKGQIDSKLAITTFSGYTGTTKGQIDSKLAISTFSGYTGTTKGQIDSKLAISTFSGYTGTTKIAIDNKIDKVTGATNNIAIFTSGGTLQSGGKQLRNDVRLTGTASNSYVSSEKGVRDAINSAIAAAVVLQGDWNATTNSPNLTGASSAYTTGFAWRVGVSGTTNLAFSGQTNLNYWRVGDLAIKAATTWIRVESQDIGAVWGNIVGTLSNQTDLQQALNAKLNISTFSGYTGTTKGQIDSKLAITTFSGYTGTTKGQIDSKLAITTFSGYTGTTLTLINTKLNTSVFTGYTASTKNQNKKIQLISTMTSNANVVTPLPITWSSAPVSANTYLWSGGTLLIIKSAGTYEVQYHVVLKNDTANQTHSVGAYLLKGLSTQPNTATAGMIVGVSASGELSLPPVVQTFAVNDILQLNVFRIGGSGNANLVTGSVFLMLNKLT